MRYLSLAIIFASPLTVMAHDTDDKPTVEHIVQMWSRRQAATRTATFHWGETLVGQQKLPQRDNRSEASQRRDYIFQLGEGAKMRSESIPLQNVDESRDSLTSAGLSVSAFNGKRSAYYTSAVTSDDHHRGIEFDAGVYDEIVNYHLRTVILCYRPLLVVRSHFSSDKSGLVRSNAELSIVDHDADLDGTPCLIIESRPQSPDPVINRFWVDVARNALILKHVEFVSGRATAETRIKYKKDSVNGWVPAIWNGRFLGTAFRSLMLDFAINEPIAPDRFEIAYPAGTVVFDRDRSKLRRILEDGASELITPEDCSE